MGGGHTCRASSTMSMARSTPAQKPRGPARTMVWSCVTVMVSSWRRRQYTGPEPTAQFRGAVPSGWRVEEERDAEDAGVRVDPPVRWLDVPVGEVLEAIPRGDGHTGRHHVRQPGSRLDDERQRRAAL